MSQWLKGLILSSGLWSMGAHADFLPPDQAFQFQAVSVSQDQAELTWQIADGYYLYHDQFSVQQQQQPLKLNLPQAQEKDDPNFGLIQVHYSQVKTTIQVQPKQTYTVHWQGCAESGLCYPVQKTTIQTDAQGLLPAPHNTAQPKAFNTLQPAILPQNDLNTAAAKVEMDEKVSDAKPSEAVVVNSASTIAQSDEIPVQTSADTDFIDHKVIAQPSRMQEQPMQQADAGWQWNNDQFFFNLLSDQHLAVNLLIFLGLGVLLAFLPCSLPLIPILSSILVQQQRGYRAALIAMTFVIGMASVYALMGLAVAQLGYSFQRWFQSPLFIGIFSLLFIAFALNLFGAFQLSLPQRLLHRLDQWQQKQQGGTLLGAALMGVIAALIVGPCMSAPLAGALLFVSQLNRPALGASYLFLLGLGLGLPLFIAAVFGAHYLPKPGLWMDRLKYSFGFVMLALALYFARPLLPMMIYLGLLASVLLALAWYVLCKLLVHVQSAWVKGVLLCISAALMYGAGSHLYQAWQHSQVAHADSRLVWQKVNTAAQLQGLLAQHQGQAVVIDVYADWCVACQPIEKEVIPRSDVQAALQDVVRIQLDLTHYDASQDQLLKTWQILGPPTFIFLDTTHQENRNLRLTGTFNAAQLLNRIQVLQGKTP